MIVLITFLSTLGVQLGKLDSEYFHLRQNAFADWADLLGVFVGRNHAAIAENFSHFWAVRNAQPIEPGANFLKSFIPTVTAASGCVRLVCRVWSRSGGFAIFL